MHSFEGQIGRVAHSAFVKNLAALNVVGLDEASSQKVRSTAFFSWGKHSESVLPETINISSANHLYLGNERKIKCLEGGGKVRALLRALTQNGALRMIEHWSALSVLLQTPLHLNFPNGETLYSSDVLADVAGEILKNRKLIEDAVHLTPEKEFRYEDPIDSAQTVVIKPAKDPHLVIRGHFDFTQYLKLAWVGKQEAEFDSQKVSLENDHLLDFVRARAPISYPAYTSFLNLLGRYTISSSLIENPDLMRPNEVARHKIVDFAGALNIGPEFLAAEIEIVKAGHRVHVEAMRQFLRETKLKPLV